MRRGSGFHMPRRDQIERTAGNLIEAAANGTTDGLRLWLNVLAMLIAFIALVTLINWPLGWIGDQIGIVGLSLARIFSWIFAPVAWLMGVVGWHDCQLMGSLLGTQISVNEFVAYQELQKILPSSGNAVVFDSVRSAKMAAYEAQLGSPGERFFSELAPACDWLIID